MAKIKKLTLDGATIYPATIMEAVKNRATNKTLAAELLTLAKAVNSGATTPDAALSALTALGTGYNSVVAVATTLKDFLTNATDSDTVINKWKEVEAFLSGITETQNLTGLLQQNLNSAKSYTDAELENIVSGTIDISDGFDVLDKYIGMTITAPEHADEYIGGYGWFALGKSNTIGLMSVTTDAMLHEIHQTVFGNFYVENGKLSSSHTDGQFNIYTRVFAWSSVSASHNGIEQLTWSEWKRNRIDNIGVPSSSSFTGTVWGEIEKLYNAATQSANGLMSAADKKKLDNIAAEANKYSLPAATDKAIGGVKLYSGASISLGSSEAPQEPVIPPTIGAANRTYPVQTLRLGSHMGAMVVNVPWTDNNTTYNAATQSADGLMSAADKKKLDAFGAATTYLTAAACNDVTDYPEITI